MMMEQRPATMTIAVAGTGDEAHGVAQTLRGIDGVATETGSATGDGLLALFARPEIDAIAFAGRVPDLPGALRATLLAGRHAFVATPAALASKQLIALDALARRRGRVLAFDDGASFDGHVAFVRRMVGPNAIWRPRYIRALCAATGSQAIDEAAMRVLSRVLSILDEAPERISAIAPRTADDAATDAAMMMLTFASGTAAHIDVSIGEPVLADDMTIVCDGRTIRIDWYDLRAPLRIHAGTRHSGPQSDEGWSESISEHPLTASGEQRSRPAQAFVDAVRGRDLAASNTRAYAAAASAWETARASMARGGEMLDVPGAGVAEASRPELQLIRGGGHTVEDAPAPALRVVAGRRARTPEPIDDDGPRSA